MSRRRDSLHHTKVQEFLEWVKAKGYQVQPVKGCYEVFRLSNPKKGEILIAHKRDRTDHVTTTGRLTQLVGVWLNEKKTASPIEMGIASRLVM